MHRVCIKKSTGELIEMQSGGNVNRLPVEYFEDADSYKEYLVKCDAVEAARLDTLRQNAINADHKEDDIEVKYVTDEEWQSIHESISQPTQEQVEAQEREELIQAKIREMAESALIAEGKLKV